MLLLFPMLKSMGLETGNKFDHMDAGDLTLRARKDLSRHGREIAKDDNFTCG